MPRILRAPIVHFLVFGAILFFGRSIFAPEPQAIRERAEAVIELRQAEVDQLTKDFIETAGRLPDESERARLIARYVEEEILFREALSRGLLERDGGVKTRLIQKMLFLTGEAEIADAPALLERALALRLHEDDIVVRRILVQKMRLAGGALAPSERPDEAAVEHAYAAQRESLRAPARRSFVHVFVSRDRHGEKTEAAAMALRDRLLESDPPPEEALRLGDPFPLGHRLELRSRDDLERSFGARFGAAVFAAPVDAWNPPISSAYGLHLVRVLLHEEGEIPPLETVSERIRLGLEDERRAEKLEALLARLRNRYEVRLLGEDEGASTGIGRGRSPTAAPSLAPRPEDRASHQESRT